MKVLNLSFCVAIVAVISWGCSSNSSTGSNNGPTDNGPYDTKGSDYVPLAANQQVPAHFRGAARSYDVNGSLTRLDSMDQDRIALLMSNATLLGLPGYSIGAYDDHGQLTRNGQPVGFVAEANGIVYTSDHDATDKAIVLPNDLSAGTWNPDPNGNPAFRASLTAHMASFTTYNGNTYSNVIKVTATDKDSNANWYGNRLDVNVINATVSFYFAKDVGPIQVDLDHVEGHDYSVTGGVISKYEQTIYSGSVARNKQ